MRVVAGRFGGRRLKGPGRLDLRPTAELVRKALFDILGTRVMHTRVLDLFAGTGSLGIEALSRGASHATFVERDRRTALLLRNNLALLDLAEPEFEIITAPAIQAVNTLGGARRRFDLILADPPYEAGLSQVTMQALVAVGLLAPEGVIVWEHRSSENAGPIGGLDMTGRRVYGDTGLSFFVGGVKQKDVE